MIITHGTQGLVFLQELKIVHGDIHREVVMMDKGTGSTDNGDNRITRNVRYYLVRTYPLRSASSLTVRQADFTHATIVEHTRDHLFAQDLRDLGLLMDTTLGNVRPTPRPCIAFFSLTFPRAYSVSQSSRTLFSR